MSKNYAVLENDFVVNVTIAEQEYARQQGWVELTGNAGIGWTYINGQFIQPVPNQPIPEEIQAKNKAQAEHLLSESDWADKPSVVDTSKALHLVNAAEWDAYRDALRMIAVVPTVEVQWPTKPEEQWSVSA